MKKLFIFLLSLPKSFYVCLKFFPLNEALRLPILVRYNTIILGLRGNLHRLGGGRIYIGFGRISEFDRIYERTIIKLNGDITIETPVQIGHGSRVIVEGKGTLKLGKRFESTANMTISCRGTIEIGDDTLVSWKTWICDTDFHVTRNTITNLVSEPDGKVVIGSNVWICANSTILKGSIVPDGCIVGANSLVNKEFKEDNCLIAGNPAQIKKRNICIVR